MISSTNKFCTFVLLSWWHLALIPLIQTRLKILTFQVLKSPNNGTIHIATYSEFKVDFITIYNLQIKQLNINLVYFFCDSAEKISHYTQNIVTVNFINLSSFFKCMKDVNVEADAIFNLI